MPERGNSEPKPGSMGGGPYRSGYENTQADTRASGNKLEEYFRQKADRYPVDQLPPAVQEMFKGMAMGTAEIRISHVQASAENENMRFDVYFKGTDKDKRECLCAVSIDVHGLRKLGYRIDQTSTRGPGFMQELTDKGCRLIREQIGLLITHNPDGTMFPKGVNPRILCNELHDKREQAMQKKQEDVKE